MSEVEKYTPEMGQAMFGQPWQELPVPNYIQAALKYISGRLFYCVGQYYRGKYEWGNPFDNSGSQHDGECWAVHAYDWSDDEDNPQLWNFRWRDFRVSWYKHSSRGLSCNRVLSPQETADMINEIEDELTRRLPEYEGGWEYPSEANNVA